MIRVLQICNVGQITGGTAACAWSVTKALPHCNHFVAFLSSPTTDTRQAFSHCSVFQWDHVSQRDVLNTQADIVILHNTSQSRIELPLPAVTIHYIHSRISPAPVDLILYCSKYLSNFCHADLEHICWQAVPKPLLPAQALSETRSLRERPVIGRICSPQIRKWPVNTPDFYTTLAAQFPKVHWEFVGCPASLQPALSAACQNRVQFFEPSWQMRSRMWNWDALLYHNPTVTESFGRTVAEAMRAGCIPVVDKRGGFIEQVPERCGYLCKNLDDFKNAVKVIHSGGHRFRLSRACRAHADEHFSQARFGRDLLDRFQQAVRNHDSSPLVAHRFH